MIIINEVVNQQLEKENKQFNTELKRELGRFWPTECSCIVCDKIQGKCARELYYSMNNITSTNPITARGLRICEAGNMYETKEIERVKKIQYYKDSGVRFNFLMPDTKITIAGKLDIIYQIDNRLIGGEIKSGYGFMFEQQVLGNTIPGLPMIKHLMQVMMYLYYFKNIDKTLGIDEFYLTYIDRGNCENIQFSIKLTDDGYPIIENEIIKTKWIMKNINTTNPYLFNQSPDGKREINKINKMINKMKYYEISIDNIFNRFKYIMSFIERKQLPPKDYKYIYTLDDIENMYKNGDITENKYEKLKDSSDIERDYQCTYCNFLRQCIADDKLYSFKKEESI